MAFKHYKKTIADLTLLGVLAGLLVLPVASGGLIRLEAEENAQVLSAQDSVVENRDIEIQNQKKLEQTQKDVEALKDGRRIQEVETEESTESSVIIFPSKQRQ